MLESYDQFLIPILKLNLLFHVSEREILLKNNYNSFFLFFALSGYNFNFKNYLLYFVSFSIFEQ